MLYFSFLFLSFIKIQKTVLIIRFRFLLSSVNTGWIQYSKPFAKLNYHFIFVNRILYMLPHNKNIRNVYIYYRTPIHFRTTIYIIVIKSTRKYWVYHFDHTENTFLLLPSKNIIAKNYELIPSEINNVLLLTKQFNFCYRHFRTLYSSAMIALFQS